MATLNSYVTVAVDDTLTVTTTGLANINLLQPTSFKLVVERKNFINLEFFCQSVAHPNIDVPAAVVPYSRIGSISMAGDKLNFGELECIIIVDENMNAYVEMFNWLNRLIQAPQLSELDRTRLKTDTRPATFHDLSLLILNSNNNTSRKIRYIDCVPTGLGNMVMEATTGDTTQITFPVTFRFSYFELD